MSDEVHEFEDFIQMSVREILKGNKKEDEDQEGDDGFSRDD